jgi:hypothetical protein
MLHALAERRRVCPERKGERIGRTNEKGWPSVQPPASKAFSFKNPPLNCLEMDKIDLYYLRPG